MRRQQIRLFVVLAIAVGMLSAVPRTGFAIPPFSQEFQAKYVNPESSDANVKKLSQAALADETGKCLVCHVAGKPKTERNDYGAALAVLLKKDNFKKARLDAEPEKVKQEIGAALDKVAAQKLDANQADSLTFGQLIAQGNLPGSPPTQEPPKPESDAQAADANADVENKKPDEQIASADAGDTGQLASLLVARIKSELKAQLVAELKPQLREEVRAELYAQLKSELKSQLKYTLRAVIMAELNASEDVSPEVEAEAIEQITQLGGTVMQLAENNDSRTVAFHLSGTELTDDGLEYLKSVNKLVHLNLKGTQITDAGLAEIAGLTSLARLNLALTSISDEGLKHLMGLDNIVYLNLYGSQVSDAGLQHLAGMTNLRKLFLWQSNVTEEGAKKLQAELPDCEVNW